MLRIKFLSTKLYNINYNYFKIHNYTKLFSLNINENKQNIMKTLLSISNNEQYQLLMHRYIDNCEKIDSKIPNAEFYLQDRFEDVYAFINSNLNIKNNIELLNIISQLYEDTLKKINNHTH